ncbi:helix-turn-helix domain-containing protein [Cruoricaptor ignavus]|nr:helix-turn-helix domain-containing protein [Cruoricaptor ignavus]
MPNSSKLKVFKPTNIPNSSRTFFFKPTPENTIVFIRFLLQFCSTVNILTKEDFEIFKEELFAELREMLSASEKKEKRWLRSSEVKKLLNISSGTLQNLRINGTIKYSKVGGTLFYDYQDIEKLFKQ